MRRARSCGVVTLAGWGWAEEIWQRGVGASRRPQRGPAGHGAGGGPEHGAHGGRLGGTGARPAGAGDGGAKRLGAALAAARRTSSSTTSTTPRRVPRQHRPAPVHAQDAGGDDREDPPARAEPPTRRSMPDACGIGRFASPPALAVGTPHAPGPAEDETKSGCAPTCAAPSTTARNHGRRCRQAAATYLASRSRPIRILRALFASHSTKANC
jgi:hypothetical protein